MGFERVGQMIALGRVHATNTRPSPYWSPETTLAVEIADGDIRRTATSGPGPLPQFLDHMSHIDCRIYVAHQPPDHSRRSHQTVAPHLLLYFAAVLS